MPASWTNSAKASSTANFKYHFRIKQVLLGNMLNRLNAFMYSLETQFHCPSPKSINLAITKTGK